MKRCPCLDCELGNKCKNNPTCESCDQRMEYIGQKVEMPVDRLAMRITKAKRSKRGARVCEEPRVRVGYSHIGFNSALAEKMNLPRKYKVKIEHSGDTVTFKHDPSGTITIHGKNTNGYMQIVSTRAVKQAGLGIGLYAPVIRGNCIILTNGETLPDKKYHHGG